MNNQRTWGGRRPGAGRPKGSRGKDHARKDFERFWLRAALAGNTRERERLEVAEAERLGAEAARLRGLSISR